jgi:hypothetical protein
VRTNGVAKEIEVGANDAMRTGLVLAGQPRVTLHIGVQDHRELVRKGLLGHGALLADKRFLECAIGLCFGRASLRGDLAAPKHVRLSLTDELFIVGQQDSHSSPMLPVDKGRLRQRSRLRYFATVAASGTSARHPAPGLRPRYDTHHIRGKLLFFK